MSSLIFITTHQQNPQPTPRRAQRDRIYPRHTAPKRSNRPQHVTLKRDQSIFSLKSLKADNPQCNRGNETQFRCCSSIYSLVDIHVTLVRRPDACIAVERNKPCDRATLQLSALGKSKPRTQSRTLLGRFFGYKRYANMYTIIPMSLHYPTSTYDGLNKTLGISDTFTSMANVATCAQSSRAIASCCYLNPCARQ